MPKNLLISQRKQLPLSEVCVIYTLQIKAIFTSEKLVNFNQTALYQIPKVSVHRNRCCVNVRSHMHKLLCIQFLNSMECGVKFDTWMMVAK